MPILEIGEHAGQHYFTMPFVGGGSLMRHLERFVADPRRAVAVVEMIARAVHCMHAKGIYHRDLKPGNVLLDDQGEPLVTDFGLAKLLDESVELTQSNQRLGTPAYMAPEQIAGENRQVGVPTDVWGLGIILYQLLTGRRPFVGETREDLANRILTAAPPSSRSGHFLPDRALEAVVLKCLEKDPARRYPTAEALAEDLRRWQAGEPLSVRPAGWLASLVKRARRNPFRIFIPLLAVLVVIAVSWQFRREDPDRALRAIEQDLQLGREVTLISETGGPQWSHWSAGQSAAQSSIEPDGTFRVHTWTLGLLDLLADPQHQRYRLRAEIRHDRRGDYVVAEAGLYVMHHSQDLGGAALHSFYLIVFDDIRDIDEAFQGVRKGPAPVKGNPVRMHPQIYSEPGQPTACDISLPGLDKRLFQPAGFRGGPWRQLTVEVTPDSVRVFWQDTLVGEGDRNQAMADARAALAKYRTQRAGSVAERATDPQFEPRGSLGLYVLNGSASFRNVRVEPLADEP
jgi:serine/threonine-protein kinase